MIPSLGPAIEHIRAGKLRPLAVTASRRSNIFPEVPVLGDFVSGYDASAWLGIGVPRSTSAEIVAKLNREINAALADPKIVEHFAEQGSTVFASSPANEFARYVVEFNDKWAMIIKSGGLKLN